MSTAIRTSAGLLAALLLAATNNAGAAPIVWNFSGALDSGIYINETFSGQFSYDDAGLLGSGDEYLSVTRIGFDFLGQHFTLADAAATVEAAYLDGAFLGLSFNAIQGNGGIALIPGFTDISQAYFAYDTPAGLFGGAGSISYRMPTTQVPEPASVALLLAGLGVLGFVRRQTKAA